MPTENRRVAAYLPKHIDARLEAFKAERGLKGDSPALLAILSEFFEVSQEMAHSDQSETTSLSKQLEHLSLKVAHLENELLGDLKNGPVGDLKNELLSELQGELFDRLKPDLRSELLGELKRELLGITSTLRSELRDELLGELLRGLKNELLDTPIETSAALGQLDLIPAEHTEQSATPDSDLLSELPNELLNSNLHHVNQSPDQIPLLGDQDVQQGAVTDSELHNSTKSKPLDGSVAWSGVELSKRLRVGAPRLAAQQHVSNEEFAEWSRSKDPDRLAWQRISKGKYFPVVEVSEEF